MLGRAHRVQPLLESLAAAGGNVRPLFVVSPEDLDVHDAIDATGVERITVPWQPCGDYARKVNAAYVATTEPLMFLGADDLHFHPGWLEAATAKLGGRVGVVGTNDLGNPRVLAGRHATHSLVTRAYADQHGTIDEPGKILHEGYVHEYVDDELVGTARKRKAFAMALDSHVEHLHPHWHPEVPVDELYEAQAARLATSRPLYRKRSRLWR
jgi:hypothetical protein